ncbi:hypothetical protein Tco_1183906 [Tanacetum coccineum]
MDDLHNNAFSGISEEDAMEHIEYFLRIIDPINLPDINHDKLRVVVFPISLTRSARRWFDGIKGSITNWDYWKIRSDEIETTDDEISSLEEYWSDEEETTEIFRIETDIFKYKTPLCLTFNEFNDLLKIDPDLLTKDIMGFKTYEYYKDDWIHEWNKNVLVML